MSMQLLEADFVIWPYERKREVLDDQIRSVKQLRSSLSARNELIKSTDDIVAYLSEQIAIVLNEIP